MELTLFKALRSINIPEEHVEETIKALDQHVEETVSKAVAPVLAKLELIQTQMTTGFQGVDAKFAAVDGKLSALDMKITTVMWVVVTVIAGVGVMVASSKVLFP